MLVSLILYVCLMNGLLLAVHFALLGFVRSLLSLCSVFIHFPAITRVL